MSPRRPLAGKVVALTRPSAGTLQEMLEALGAQVIHAPAIRRAPPRSRRALQRAAAQLREGAYAAVAFTSATAVEALLEIRPSPRAALGRVIVAAVGDATAAALVARGLAPQVKGGKGGAALAAPLLRALRRTPGVVLLPRAEHGREELPAALRKGGVEVQVVAAYRTLPARKADLAPLERALTRGAVHVVVVASPSAVESLARSCPHLGSATLVAIGPTTAAAARAHELAVVAAIRPDDAALLRAVKRALIPLGGRR